MSPAVSWLLAGIVVGVPVALGFWLEGRRKRRLDQLIRRIEAHNHAAEEPSGFDDWWDRARHEFDGEGEALPPGGDAA